MGSPGSFATVLDAVYAGLLELPTTKLSKVYSGRKFGELREIVTFDERPSPEPRISFETKLSSCIVAYCSANFLRFSNACVLASNSFNSNKTRTFFDSFLFLPGKFSIF